jgi:hypothetical protein
MWWSAVIRRDYQPGEVATQWLGLADPCEAAPPVVGERKT